MDIDVRRLCFQCFQEKTTGGVCPHCGYDPAADQGQYPLALPRGSVLAGRYIVGRVLGQGGFGITYVALDVQHRIRVAVKEYMPETMATRQTGTLQVTAFAGSQAENFAYGKDQFLEEARTLARFASVGGIVSVHTYFEENGTAYFAMEYVEGTSFKSFIKQQGGKVSWPVARSVLIPVMDALGKVHQDGIIHRDVTPDNIYINKEGGVKLLDFGAARYSVGDRSRSLDVVLKAGYAPKEQYVRRGRQGPFTDVYSVAACFYASMTGYLPPESLERMEEDNLVPPTTRGVSIPSGVEDVILKGLEVRAEDRYQNMTAFKDALMAADPSPLLPIFPGAKPPMEANAHPAQPVMVEYAPPVSPAPAPQPASQPAPQPAVQPPVVQAPVSQVPPPQVTVVQTPGANVSVSYVKMDGSGVPVSQTPASQTPVSQTPASQTPVSQTPTSQIPVSQPPVQPGPMPGEQLGRDVPPAMTAGKKSHVGLWVGLGVGGGVLVLLLAMLGAFLLLNLGGNKDTSPYSDVSFAGPVSQQINYENGDSYVGDMVNGIPEGEGEYTWFEGCSFKGTFVQGNPCGSGTFTFTDGTTKTSDNWEYADGDEYTYTSTSTYAGQVSGYYYGMKIGNEAFGYGEYIWEADDPFCPDWQYIGEMNNDQPNGMGKLSFGLFDSTRTSCPYYYGQIVEGSPEGAGTFYFTDGSAQEGTWSWCDGKIGLSYSDRQDVQILYYGMTCDGSASGYGQMEISIGSTFVGEFLDSCISGRGIYTCTDGTIVSGDDWSESMADIDYSGMRLDGGQEGFGVYLTSDGDVYQGEYMNGFKNGFGTYAWADGDYYEGQWSDGDREGTGTYTWADGDVYVGDFLDNKRTGTGTYTWASTGNTYVGDFVEGERTGKGVYTFKDSGTVYEGDFVNGSFEGNGKMTWTDGEMYEGQYSGGKRHGQGTYVWPNGDTYTGSWVNGERTGYGKYVYADGTVQEGQWDNNTFLG